MSQGFSIKSIRLKNFRNYESFNYEYSDGLNSIIGANATGKTNIIEAISLMTQISSFRNSLTSELVNKNTGEPASVEVEILDYSTDTKNEFSLKITDGKKAYSLNGKRKQIVDCKGRFPSVIFTPDNLSLVKGSNSERRDALDSLGSQLSKDYYKVCKDYNKALKQKNALLREGSSLQLLQSINDVLMISAAQLCFYRVALVNKIKPVISKYYSEIAGENEVLEIEYYASWDLQNQITDISRDQARGILSKELSNNIHEEQVRSRALIGPHRDKIKFVLNDSDAQNFASQGQQRSIVLAFKLTEVQLIEDLLDKRPILLLDDVMSELDQSRQEKLKNFINKQTQTFITSTC